MEAKFECKDLRSFNASAWKKTETACQLAGATCPIENGFINYIEFILCFSGGATGPVILIFIWLAILLLGVAVTADSFFGPCLIVVTRILRMSQNLAGVTLLAFGNGAADIFSAISSVSSNDDGNAGLAFGGILGAGLAVNCVTGGIIMIIRPFSCARRPVIKDLFFYFLICAWILSIFIKQKVYLVETIGFIVLYAIYVGVTVGGRAYYATRESDDTDETTETTTTINNANIEMATITNGQENQAYLKEMEENRPNPFFPSHPAAQTATTSSAAHLEVPNQSSQAPTTPSEGGSQHIHRTGSARASSRSLFRHQTYLARYIIANKPSDDDTQTISNLRHSKSLSTADGSVEKRRPKSVDAQVKRTNSNRSSNSSTSTTTELPRYRSVSAADGKKISTEKPKFGNFLAPPGQVNFTFTVEDTDTKTQVSNTAMPIILPEDPNKSKEEIITDIAIHDEGNEEEEEEIPYEYPGLKQDFINQLIPIDRNDWPSMTIINKIIEIIRSPIVFILRMTIPVVDEEKPLNGWSKILNTIHCITTPIFILFATQFALKDLGGGFYVIYLMLLILPLIAAMIWFTSWGERPPVYHGVYAFVGFMTSIIWIYTFANEIVNILNTIGFQFKISEAILGLSLLAWANSVADMMSNVVLAKNNYPRIAYAACIGGPLFNALLGLGIPFTIKCIANGGSYAIQSSTVQFVLIGFLLGVLTLKLITIPLVFKFHLRLPLGVTLIAIYIVFFIVALLCESNVF